jgi:hypothetical protein
VKEEEPEDDNELIDFESKDKIQKVTNELGIEGTSTPHL